MNQMPKATIIKTIVIANDHAGLPLKQFLIKHNTDQSWEDLGTHNEQATDYPDHAKQLCKKIHDSNHQGVLICKSGQGMAMAANRFSGIRAAVAWNEVTARLAREHNNANVLCLGAGVLSFEEANKIFRTFIRVDFLHDRHTKRIMKLDQLITSNKQRNVT